MINSGPGYQSHSDHIITANSHASRVVVHAGATTVAESDEALGLSETGYPTAVYLSKQDVRMELLVPTDRTTYCPFKGRA